jgi:hypothetical protein
LLELKIIKPFKGLNDFRHVAKIKYMDHDKNRHGRPESYPKPTETDSQLKNQPEYIDQQPNDFRDKSISDLPASTPDRTVNDPKQDLQDGA